jgi:uncharacterized protein YpmB
LKAK